jgi:hypothetical protein
MLYPDQVVRVLVKTGQNLPSFITSGRSPGRDTHDKFNGVAQCECK